MSELRDYVAWHRQYDDPSSSLSWRLAQVQELLRDELVSRSGRLRLLSACSGDGRDVIGVLADSDNADRVEVFLLELHPEIADRARAAASAAGLPVQVRTVDAGLSSSYADVAPADIVLLVGIFGNISRADLDRTVQTAPQFCRPGALVVWSRAVDEDDINDDIRAQFAACDFVEVAYASRGGSALGAVRYAGPPVALVPGRRLFSFLR